MAVAVRRNGRITPATDIVDVWHERVEQAKRDRARFEPNWQQSLAYAAGKQWLKWHRTQRRLVLPELDRGRERYTVDELSPIRYTVLGELGQDDERPELQFRQEDVRSREYTEQANDAVEFGWDNEWEGAERFASLRLTLIDLGTAAIRVRYDPTAGPLRQQVPVDENRRPILDPQAAHEHVAQMMLMGQQAQIRDVHEGRIRWDVGSPFNLLVPPGIEHDWQFPWIIWVTAVPLNKLRLEYGQAADGLSEDSDVGTVNLLGPREIGDASDPTADPGQPGKLTGHTRVYSCYEQPCRDHPKGQMVVLAGSEYRPLLIQDELPYRKPDESYCSGVTVFHYQRVTGRFWGRSLVDPAKDPQRLINKRRSQIAETIDRGQAKVFVEEGSLPWQGDGAPAEYVAIKSGSPLPQVFPGIQPGAWMQADVEAGREDLQRVTGVHPGSIGDIPPAANGNYSYLALAREIDLKKFGPIIDAFKLGVKSVVEDTVWDMRQYWGAAKQVVLAGDEGELRAHVFNATEIPPFFIVRIPSGTTLPRSQAAKLALIDSIWQGAIAAQTPLPVSWLKESYEAGQPMPLPEPPADSQLVKAQLENSMLEEGQQVTPAYFDPPEVHVPVHRELEVKAILAGDSGLAARVEQHVQAHLQMAQQNAVQNAQAMQGPPGLGGPPGGPQAVLGSSGPPGGAPGGQSPLQGLAAALAQHQPSPSPVPPVGPPVGGP